MSSWSVGYDADLDRGYIRNDEQTTPVEHTIQFQHGPIGDEGCNGIQNEELLQLLIIRTNALDLRMPCPENQEAIECMKSALAAFNVRTEKRIAKKVEGTNRPHSNTEKIIKTEDN